MEVYYVRKCKLCSKILSGKYERHTGFCCTGHELIYIERRQKWGKLFVELWDEKNPYSWLDDISPYQGGYVPSDHPPPKKKKDD